MYRYNKETRMLEEQKPKEPEFNQKKYEQDADYKVEYDVSVFDWNEKCASLKRYPVGTDQWPEGEIEDDGFVLATCSCDKYVGNITDCGKPGKNRTPQCMLAYPIKQDEFETVIMPTAKAAEPTYPGEECGLSETEWKVERAIEAVGSAKDTLHAMAPIFKIINEHTASLTAENKRLRGLIDGAHAFGYTAGFFKGDEKKDLELFKSNNNL